MCFEYVVSVPPKVRSQRRAPRKPDPAKRWLTFLRNDRESIAAMDFFTVPTVTFGVLYCFFIIGHDRRKILRFNVTRNPHALWIVQQLREAWPYTPAHRFLLLDRHAKFRDDVVSSAKAMGSEPVRTGFRSPWQNGVAERWAGSCRRDLLDQVIILNGRHLKRLMSEYMRYYHEDRTHLGLAKDTPAGRRTAIRSTVENKISLLPSVGWAAPPLRFGCLKVFSLLALVGQPASVCYLVGGIDHPQKKEAHRQLDLTMLSRDVCLGAAGFEEPQRLA